MSPSATYHQRRVNTPPVPGAPSTNAQDIEVSDTKKFAQLYRHLADSQLSQLELPADSIEAGVGGKTHPTEKATKTGTARRSRVPVMYFLLRKMSGGVIGAGRAAWDYLSVRQIMLYTGYSRRHVQRTLRELEYIGVIRTRMLDNATSVYEVVESRLEELAKAGVSKVVAALRSLRSAKVLAVLGGPKAEQQARQDEEEANSYVDIFEGAFAAGDAKHCGVSERSARRLCKARGIDAFTWKQECEAVYLAFQEARHGVADTVRNSPHLLIHRKKWAQMVRLGNGLLNK